MTTRASVEEARETVAISGGYQLRHIIYRDGWHELEVADPRDVRTSGRVRFSEIAYCGDYFATTDFFERQRLPRIGRLGVIVDQWHGGSTNVGS